MQYVSLGDQPARIEPGLERSRHPRTIVNGHGSTVAPIDANLHQRTTLTSAAPEFDELESDRINLGNNNGFQRFVHVVSKAPHKNKKMWGASPTFRSRNEPAQQLKGTRALRERQLERTSA